ncbi:hypothetical protein SAMN04489802_3696 [Pseudomonas chlororaphis]|uniref:hypothetical protein n=1 Tax=Pseudomonas chlororaphis TaxID=587753 RepID=UPI00087BDE5E|nr:hypothetical protein [Pseudomonas chlororaphis]AZD66705.1 hypothetical protein C4K17_2819 [Pseudomonas chlororaphis subsp. aurantiaca]AZD73184.1 hypothetical protein C4K16_2824 [Pseudomonas chlororaphis subsp. aurantiaca]QIT22750.1 hypothetical protein HCN09_13770 [Pseudomonas chlororaphis subsp. aurantiaca]WDH06924.1 hypothetical protein PUP57_14900 [Pseudomonas chlororaphis]WDH10322.1 hypothetical protein PUP64_32115 [Pseudomonas chlororaphis]
MTRALSLVFCLSLILSGCELAFLPGCYTRPELKILPQELPVAISGQPFNVRLEVPPPHTRLMGFYIDPATPLPSGLELTYQRGESHALISGTPRTPGVYKVSISALSNGTQCVGQQADSTYQLKVVAPSQP